MALVMALGFWLILAPTVLSYADAGIDAASWNDRVVGPVAVAAVLRMVTPVGVTVLGLVVAGLGGWLVAAPLLLGYDGAPQATANDLAVGAAVILLAPAVGDWFVSEGGLDQYAHMLARRERLTLGTRRSAG